MLSLNFSSDIYKALDMRLSGILSYQSICNGNMPIEVPDFRVPGRVGKRDVI